MERLPRLNPRALDRVVRVLCAAATAALSLAGCGGADGGADNGVMIIDASNYSGRSIEDAVLTSVACRKSLADSTCEVKFIETAVIATGRVFALGEGKLLRLDDSGAAVVARDGGGPGELRAPIALGTGRDSAVAVFDIGRMRLISMNGETSPEEIAVFPPADFRTAKVRTGHLYAYTLPPAAAVGNTVDAAIVRFVPTDSAWTDTIARFPEPAVSVRGEGGAAASRLPWDPMVLWDVCDDGEVLVGHSDVWAAQWHRSGDSTSRVRRVERSGETRTAMTDAEHDSISRDWLERSPKVPSFRAELGRRLATKPQYRPVLSAVFCGEHNSAILVNTPDFGAGMQTVDIIAKDGTGLRSIRVPAHIRLTGAFGNELVGVDPTDHVDVVYRIEVTGR